MKNINLKYVVVALVLAMQWSCSTNDGPAQAEKQIELRKNGGEVSVEEDIHTYVLDGQVITNKALIDKSITKAFFTNYDFPKNKCVICSNQRQFDKYLVADPELKKRLDENDAAAKIEDSKPQEIASRVDDFTKRTASSSATSASAIPDWTSYNVADYSSGFFTTIDVDWFGDGSATQFDINNHQSIPDLYKYFGTTIWDVNNYTGSNLPRLIYTTLGSLYTFGYNNYSNKCAIYIRNAHDTATRTRTYYTGINYTGTANARTLGPNTHLRLASVLGIAKSYK